MSPLMTVGWAFKYALLTSSTVVANLPLGHSDASLTST